MSNNVSVTSCEYSQPVFSIVVPVYNEEDNIAPLIKEIREALDGQLQYEIVYVDDGSTDNTLNKLKSMTFDTSFLRIVRHRRACGQSAAILSGVKAAQADWVITIDGDGQNDPADILRLAASLEQMEQAAEMKLVTGFRKKRQDSFFKRLSSKIANGVRRRLLKDETLDTGCGLKLFFRRTFLELPRFDHMHRFLPALFLRHGGSVMSVEINHRPRTKGVSKYGVHNRLWVGVVDLLGVMWLQRRIVSPELVEDEKIDVQ